MVRWGEEGRICLDLKSYLSSRLWTSLHPVQDVIFGLEYLLQLLVVRKEVLGRHLI